MNDKEIGEVIRRHWATMPVNIEQIIRDCGISLEKSAPLDSNIAGELRKLDNGGYRISVQKKDHYFRRRFTMAHEFGHYYLHRTLIGEGIDDNVRYRSTADGAFYNTSIEQKHEREANAFAAAVLMPTSEVRKAAKAASEHGEPLSADALRAMAVSTFLVSPQALRLRLDALGIGFQ